MSRATIALFAVGAFTAAASAQFTLVAPDGYAAAEGNASNTYPWQRNASPIRIQFIYDSSHFTNQSVVSPVIISNLRYRANASTATWAGGTWPTVQIDMATATSDYLTPSTTFATNMGPDLTTVLNGPVTVQPGTGNGTGVPGPWYIDIPLSTTFLYDPTTGNDLVVDIMFDGVGWTGASTSADHVSGTTVVPPPMMSRVYSTVGPTAVTGTVGTNYGAVCEFTYVPANGLFANFNADVTNGVSPQTVNFTDNSYSSDPAGILAWAWDFDGDSVVDSTLQNPTHVYSACGTYNVSLTVVDASHPAATETKVGYITIDGLNPDFTASVSGGFSPVNVQFTDTTTGPVLAWLWDLDGDTVTDSNLQHPTWVYTTPGTYSVSLTVINGCNNLTVTKTNLITVLAQGAVPAPPEVLQYQFNEVRGTTVANTASTPAAPAQGTMSTATWQSDSGRPLFKGNEAGFGCLGYRATGAGAVATGWPTSVTGSCSVSFWLRKDPAAVASPFGYAFSNGTFRAFVGGAAGNGITFRGSPIGNVDSGFTVNGTPGVWNHYTVVVDDTAGQALWYENGVASATVVSFTPNTFTYTGNNMVVGASTAAGGSAIGTGYDMDDFRFYSRALLPAEVLVNSLLGENATAGSAGSFCDGPGGTPVISGNGSPTLGNAGFTVDLSNAENARLAALVFGVGPAAAGVVNISQWFGAGCELQTDLLATNFHVTASNAASQAFAIPQNTAFQGYHVYAQWLILGTAGAATRLLDINLQ